MLQIGEARPVAHNRHLRPFRRVVDADRQFVLLVLLERLLQLRGAMPHRLAFLAALMMPDVDAFVPKHDFPMLLVFRIAVRILAKFVGQNDQRRHQIVERHRRTDGETRRHRRLPDHARVGFRSALSEHFILRRVRRNTVFDMVVPLHPCADVRPTAAFDHGPIRFLPSAARERDGDIAAEHRRHTHEQQRHDDF